MLEGQPSSSTNKAPDYPKQPNTNSKGSEERDDGTETESVDSFNILDLEKLPKDDSVIFRAEPLITEYERHSYSFDCNAEGEKIVPVWRTKDKVKFDRENEPKIEDIDYRVTRIQSDFIAAVVRSHKSPPRLLGDFDRKEYLNIFIRRNQPGVEGYLATDVEFQLPEGYKDFGRPFVVIRLERKSPDECEWEECPKPLQRRKTQVVKVIYELDDDYKWDVSTARVISPAEKEHFYIELFPGTHPWKQLQQPEAPSRFGNKSVDRDCWVRIGSKARKKHQPACAAM
ncbi:hypothetical protein BJ508DRAFT_379935 [Ascobolus immersus RN42]|uniref:Uncharacterized protein n=1 Tax=Ascobolus immersus RN42 TaxID=1160509 RepID=A0A3N4HP46_ASCIM|nr:hypothetical protein BJ508DRAFT_379935 [Ascobolus immersus RN42]